MFCIFNPYMQNRTGLSWTLCVFISPKTMQVILPFTPPSWSGIQNTVTLVSCAFPRGNLCQRNCGRPITRTWGASARPESQTVLFSWGLETSGSASFCYFSESVQRPTLGCSSTSVPTSVPSTMRQEKQVIFWIFCMLCTALWTSTSLVCHSSHLHTGTSSCCSESTSCCSETCKENQRAFLELLAKNARTVAMNVGDGTWTAGPLDGGPSNNGNKQPKTLRWDS